MVHVKLQVTLERPPFRYRRLLALVSVVGPVLSVALTLLAQAIQPDFDALRQTVSILAVGPWGWLQTLSFLVFSLALLAFAVGLFFGIRRRRGFRTTVTLLALAALGVMTVGIFPTDGPGSALTTSGYVHAIAANTTSIFFLLAQFLIVPILRGDARWRRLAGYTLAAGMVTLFLVIAKMDVFVEQVEPVAGLHERVLMLNGLIWIEVLAVRLLALSPESKADAPAGTSGGPRQ